MLQRWYYPYWYRRRTRFLVQIGLTAALAAFVFAILFKFISLSSVKGQPQITLWREDIGQAVRMPLEEYVAGVLAAEMPAAFHLEALKAGAVAARTYALRRIANGETIPGKSAHVSSDHRVSQAYLAPESLLSVWGSRRYLASWPKIKLAVTATRGQVLTYGNELIQALYHSTSGGVTANSEDYYASAVPYLRAVASPWETQSPYWRTAVAVTYQDLVEKLAVPVDAQMLAAGDIPITVNNRASGRTEALALGEHRIPARTVREKLGLRSDWFAVTVHPQALTFEVRGNGHGVGMSQYGANGLAAEGYSYDSILLHYYQGVHLVRAYR